MNHGVGGLKRIVMIGQFEKPFDVVPPRELNQRMVVFGELRKRRLGPVRVCDVLRRPWLTLFSAFPYSQRPQRLALRFLP